MKMKLNPAEQLSPQLADLMPVLSLTGDPLTDAERVQSLLTFFEFIYSLGDAEHSNDWDPALAIQLKDGRLIGDESGYCLATLRNNDTQIHLEWPKNESELRDENKGLTTRGHDLNDQYPNQTYLVVELKDIDWITYNFH